ncbi:DNA (cytosine-5)-methyltransferase 1 [Alternaria panax]|uniref:DNA (cytosine-5-)-methyltransferase n=1 Tax=Alternaria panax TaxID=48097 RepID=A0AAD4FKC3_9PLEO|nr:DNA (cytosine-5)-methyltransferase 1 [Alternaria panax]
MPPILAEDGIAMLEPDSKKRRRSAQSAHTRHWSEPTISLSATSDFARSHVANWSSPVPVTPESEALRKLKTEWNRQSRGLPFYHGRDSEKKLLIVDLQDFEIYRAPESDKRAYELTALHHLEVPITKKLCFDGFICLGATKYYVHAVPIQDSSVEGYGDRESAGVTTYIQSTLASRDTVYNVWYRLNQAAPGYREFQRSFVWVAQLGKHVIDYLESQSAGTVGLNDFREDFHAWVTQRFARCADFEQWHRAFRRQTDFRVGVNAYIEYFYNQAFNLPNSKQLLAHPLWSECLAKGLTAVETQEQVIAQTIATPEVFNCFKDMYFGGQLREQRPVEMIVVEQERRKRKLGFAKRPSTRQTTSMRPNVCKPYGNSPVRVGDVVAWIPDKVDSSVWKNTDWHWLAYVQATETLRPGVQKLSVLWIYRHCETNIYKATYPYDNEVFLSDNCNCTNGELLSTDIEGRYDVDWSPTVIDTNRFFIRQTYITQESAFVSFRSSHKTCTCLKPKSTPINKYRRGDTVYLERTLHNDHILDPVVVYNIDLVNAIVKVRKLLRLKRDCEKLAASVGRANLALNELVLTNDYEDVAISRIQRRCFVRFVPKHDIQSDRIPFTYSRGGAGDLWFLAMGLIAKGKEQNLVFLRALPNSFNEGPKMTSPQPLRGMSLFSGGGSLDRGLEEGGAVAFHSAVDFSQHAIHTQRANSKTPKTMCLFCGSVDDHFNAALEGNKLNLVPRVGEVDFIAAGSPCPGFSALQHNFLSKQSLRNASHISTFCSYVDLYRPLYGVLENVVNMASTRVGYEDQNVLSQVVACLVSLGYQCNQYIMDAWSYGSAQQRSRLILTIAAPGLEPIAQPWHTHARPYEGTTGRSLGYLLNGERFGEREYYPTPFAYVPAVTVDDGLPDIGTGILQTCIPFPDHRVAGFPTRKQRALVKCIPRQPPGSGYKEADQRGLIPTLLRDSRTEIGKAYSRIKADGLVPTITTNIVIRDSRNGATLHWDQHRSISVLEARRTQGYMDEEPIIGNLTEQYKIVGNGVDRKVAFAMGLALLRAVQKNDAGFTADRTTQNSAEMIDFTSDTTVESDQGSGSKVDYKSVVPEVLPVRKKERTRSTGPVLRIPRRSKTVETTQDDRRSSVASGKDTRSSSRPTQKPIETQHAQSRSSERHNPNFFSRLSKSLSASVDRLSLSSMAYSRPVTIPMPMKRSREDDVEDSTTESESHYFQERPRKQPRVSETPTLGSTTSGEVENFRRKSVFSHRHSRRSSSSSSTARRTRHSGLSVEFVPKNWDKRPEVETRGLDFEEEFV